jgi:hypothetical protein
MNDVLAVGKGERFQDVANNGQRLLEAERPEVVLLAEAAQVASRDVFHDERRRVGVQQALL